ncbi:putative O-methyltransferase [Actinoplanes missouriensis 431]|uniref:Putative O-methyltransferase n=1 Tax=Actinoplanes missouriensis (strain ATCC 14538 / DSM 43046 / CBS 188.64 / JCM 3121 / NBRC 102363 / NCIMB 12654 / NRRL B-3342 / UNCC 431) TaxID=512565 RepID=I0HC38_ACTM4|nr:O-methyltransferase [Actinoplanes missouriensis]BAL90575.1 putative O-methyltransferase [Actinoplanes missouriensis 431]
MADIVDPAVADYVRAHATPADDLLRGLAAETSTRYPPDAGMQISADEGALLTMLTRLTGVLMAVEIGTFTGYSSICIARGLRPGGRLIACDVSEEWTSIARTYWAKAGLADRIELRLGPAIETVRALPADPVIDFVFLDADKTGYPAYYEEIVPRLRPGGLLVVDNVLRHGQVLDPRDASSAAVAGLNDRIVGDERVESVMLPVRDGVTLVRRRA